MDMGLPYSYGHKKGESAPDIISNGFFPLIDLDTECLQKK
jgi:hypothetical protein